MGITSHSIISALWAAGNARTEGEERVTASLKEQCGSVSHLSESESHFVRFQVTFSLLIRLLCICTLSVIMSGMGGE